MKGEVIVINEGKIKEKVYQCLKKVIPNEQIDDEVILLDRGIDSMTFIKVIVTIEEMLNIQVESSRYRNE